MVYPNQHGLECECDECEMYYKEEIEKLSDTLSKDGEE